MNRRQALLVLPALAAARAALAQGNGPIRVATDATFPPFESLENGKPVGFDIDLVNAIGARIGRPVEWTSIDFKGLIPGVLARRFDMAVSAIYITPERERVVNFSDPYYEGGLVILKRRDNDAITKPADLVGKTVSIQVGTKSVSFLSLSYPNTRTTIVETNAQMFDMLRTRRVDAVVTGRPAALLFVKANPEFAVVAEPLTQENYGMVVHKDLVPLRDAVNGALRDLRADGTYRALVTKWFGDAA